MACQKWQFSPAHPCCNRPYNIRVYRPDGSTIWRQDWRQRNHDYVPVNDHPDPIIGYLQHNITAPAHAVFDPDGRLFVGGVGVPVWPPPAGRPPTQRNPPEHPPTLSEMLVTGKVYPADGGGPVAWLYAADTIDYFVEQLGLSPSPSAVAAAEDGRFFAITRYAQFLNTNNHALRGFDGSLRQLWESIPVQGLRMQWRDGMLIFLGATLTGNGFVFGPDDGSSLSVNGDGILTSDYALLGSAVYGVGQLVPFQVFDSNFNLTAEYPVPEGQALTRIAASPDGTLIVAGFHYVAKFTTVGEVLWSVTLSEDLLDVSSLVVDSEGRITVGCGPSELPTIVGFSEGVSRTECIVQFDTDGQFQWAHFHHGIMNMALGPNDRVAAVGWRHLSTRPFNPLTGDIQHAAERSYVARTEVLDEE